MSTRNLKSFVEVNGCKHYFLNEDGTKDIYFIHSSFLVEEDYMLKHPFGRVYKPKGCIDTLIRFVRQPNNSTLMFRVHEWNIPSNPFYLAKPTFRLRNILDAFYDRDSYV
jgi:hypothetical protein